MPLEMSQGLRQQQFIVINKHDIRFYPVVFLQIELIDPIVEVGFPTQPELVGEPKHLGIHFALPASDKVAVVDRMDFAAERFKRLSERLVKSVPFWDKK